MAAAVMGTDIDSFIREQKAKLASERHALDDGEGQQSSESASRRHWDRRGGREAQLAVEESRPRTQEGGLPLTNTGSRQKQRELAEQRNREYNQYLKHGKDSRAAHQQDDDEISNPSIIPFNRADEDRERKRRMEVERQREYQQMKARLDEANRRGRRDGSEERRHQPVPSHQPDRRTTDRASLLEQTDEYKANQPGMGNGDLSRAEKERQRNEEYNQFLRENNAGRRTRSSDRDVDGEYGTSLPGLRNSHSAKARREQQRNQEYNQFLASRQSSHRDDGRPPPAPRKGWATPTYEDILDKKREQEAQYRRNNDPGYGQALELSRLQDYNQNGKPREPLDLPRNPSPQNPSPRNRSPPQRSRTRQAPREDPSQYYATLPLGRMSSEEAKRRQKEQYRDELQKQMREAAEGRRREKAQDMKVNYSGLLDPEERKPPPVPVTNASRATQPPPAAPSLHLDGLDKFDRLNTRSELALGRHRVEDLDRNQPLGSASNGLLDAPFSLSRGGGDGGGLLDRGFSSLLEGPRMSNLAPPPGLEYQPASYITKGGGGLGLTSVEDAYDFYATHNPLDTNLPAAGGGGGGLSRPVQASQDRSYTSRGGGGLTARDGAGGGGGGLTPRDWGGGGAGRGKVRFEDEPARHLATMDFPTDDDKKRQAQKKAQAYQEELNRQIEEKKRKKVLEKEEKERYDRKLEQEAMTYNPYGRGGGGAPMRDAYGNIVSDLRSMRRDNDPESGNRPPPPPSQPSAYAPSAPVAAVSTRDDLFGPPPTQMTADGELSHARGGHGIFGMPKTNEEKVASERYKDDLRRQIEERKIEEMRKKELERQEEEREQRRLDEQRERMQLEYEEEQRRIKEKEEEARKKNEELVRQAEERKREAEQRRKEAEEKRMEEERREKEAEMNARLAEARETASPPVPAARTRAVEDEPLPSTSKEEPAPVSRAASADVLNQLAVMRKQLQSERQRVEDMLQTEKKTPDVFDPRLMQKPPARPEMDVFETARHGNAVAVRRTPGDRANGQAMEDFNALKHQEDSDSRREFRRLFPEQPASGDNLEVQQAALIRHQENSLRALRDQSKNDESGYPKSSFALPSARAQSRTPHQLNSNSAFVDVDGLNYFPDDFDDMPGSHRNESARARRRNRQDLSPRAPSRGYGADPFGSTTSLNVDRLSKKNEDRLKRLREMQGDDMSLYDPDDVLDRFMSKQAHNRPPSGQTLQDDSWMYTGAASKASGY